MTRIAYLDESFEKGRYIVAAFAVDHRSVVDVRQQLRSHAPKGASRRHFVNESQSERRKMLDTFRALPGTEVLVWVETRTGSTLRRRHRALEAAVGLLLPGGLDRIVLDHVHAHQQAQDRQTLGRALNATALGRRVAYSHEPAHSTEPMLWVPDAAAWCARRTDRWRTELDGWASVHRP
jgi:hypothetical protein